MGNILQGKGHINRRQKDLVDKAGSNRNLGVVRSRANVGVEEFVSTHGGEQEAGLSTSERRSLGDDSKPMVEIYHGQACGASPSTNKLKLISSKIKYANLGKISD